jgi:hypothetical protein
MTWTGSREAGGRVRLLVHATFGRAEFPEPDAAPHENVDEQVGSFDQQSAESSAAEGGGEQPGGEIVERPGPGVADHESPEPFGVLGGHPAPDRAAPVLHHHRDIAQPELLDEAFDDPGRVRRW